MEKNYNKALKLGKNSYKKSISNGEFPYLPVLDEMLPLNKNMIGVDLGLQAIPIDFVVGTKTKGRTAEFARNFMPIADERSEFADKWEALCTSHLEEGIRDPIMAWEFMNRYYVQEGNKRVSVLKFFGAKEVYANVKRILPEKTGDKFVDLYYEYLDFNKATSINFIEFTKNGSYLELLDLLGKKPNEKWTEEEVRRFKNNFYYFEKAYNSIGGYRLKSTVGDAMLTYIRVYGYEALRTQSENEIKQNLSKAWKEVRLQEEEKPIEIKMNPQDSETKNIFTSLINVKKKKVAFIYGGDINKSGWRQKHELGRLYVQKALADKIETKAYTVFDSIENTIWMAILDGANIVFTTEVNMLDASVKMAVAYPKVKILNCSLNKAVKSVQTYYPRMYEAKFICGVIAGSLTKSNKIGYITKYPIYGTIAEINAFARGVQLTNPYAKVYLEWSSLDGVIAAQNRLLDKGIQLISYREHDNLVVDNYRKFGLAYVNGDDARPVALPVWDWEEYYKKLLLLILDGSVDTDEKKTTKSVAYYWGISSGVVDIIYSQRLPKGTRYLAEIVYQSIKNGQCLPFYNPEKNPDESFDWQSKNQSLSIEEVINMDWLEENVVGEIPKYDQLEDPVKEVVDKLGVKPAREIKS